jgi:hypothetical protein
MLRSQDCPPKLAHDWPLYREKLKTTLRMILRIEDAKALVVDWHGRGYPAKGMHWKLLTFARTVLPAYFSIKNWTRAIDWGESILSLPSLSGCWPDEWINRLVADALEEADFHSRRSGGSTAPYRQTIAWGHLHTTGSETPIADWVEMENRLKQVMLPVEHHRWRSFSTVEVCWYDFSIDRKAAWIAKDDNEPNLAQEKSEQPRTTNIEQVDELVSARGWICRWKKLNLYNDSRIPLIHLGFSPVLIWALIP